MMKVRQEQRVCQLLAHSSDSKEGIELSIEELLRVEYDREVTVQAEEFPDATNTWKVTVDPEGRC